MNLAAFVLLAAVLTSYVLLDGYDLGVGAMHLLLARSDADRRDVLRAIGPFWNGNEVMLIAAGALLFALFPRVYASAFSGFYLPLIIVLWLFMVRGISIELRDQFSSGLWSGFWDVGFSIASGLLALVFGVALANVLRGVPLNASGFFAGTFAFLLNPYALAVGVFAVFALAMHGCAFLWMRGAVVPRAQQYVRVLWPIVLVLYAGVTAYTLQVHPAPGRWPLWIAPAAAVAALVALRMAKNGARALAASSVFLFALMVSAAGTLFPYLLPAYPAWSSGGLTIFSGAPGQLSLQTAFAAGIIGFGAALVYGTLVARRLLADPNR